MKKSKLIQLYKLKSINIENKKQQELRKMYNFYERKLAEEKSRFDSLLRDKIKQGKRLKRAKKGIEYWKNECEKKYNAYMCIDGVWLVANRENTKDAIDLPVENSEVVELKKQNQRLEKELESEKKDVIYNNLFDTYKLEYRQGRSSKHVDLIATDDNDNAIIVGKKHE